MLKRSKSISLLLILMLTMSLISGCKQEQEVVKETEITVTTANASIRDIAKTLKLAGTVRGKNEVYIMAKVPARVTAIYAKPGQAINQGQTILTLDSSDYEAGVQQGQAALRLAQVQLETATSNLERSEKLHEAGALSTQQFEAARAGLDAAQAGVEQAAAALQMAQNQIENCIITAPISGIVGNINVSLGDTASPSSPVAVVSNTSELEVEVLASESEVSYIESGSEVGIVIKAITDEPFKGQVESVATVPDPMKKNYAVKVSLPNEDNQIKSGMFAEVSLSTVSKNGAVCVPAAALVIKGARTVIYTVDGEKRARENEVTVGIENSQYVEIASGIKEGEEVITKGNTLVADGTLLRVVAGGGK